MELILTRPLCFFDIEATGIDIKKDRIIELSILKIYPNKKQESKTWLINPNYPISKESSLIHGIKDEDIANQPTFKEVAKEIISMIKQSDLAGYNSTRFDIPLLAEEMIRANISFDLRKHKSIDIQIIFHKMEPRTLEAAYLYYCKKKLTNAHRSMNDTMATYEIFKAQLEKYPQIKGDVKEISQFSSYAKLVDAAGLIHLNDKDQEVFGFGKYKGKNIQEVFKNDPSYYNWIQKGDFPLSTKQVITTIKLRDFNKLSS